jgi:hypothetical protein
MSIKSLKSGLYSNSVITGNAVILPGDYESIATVNLSANTSSVTFSSIPATFTHLQLRAIVRTTRTGGPDILGVRYNNDSGNNYVQHNLYGDGSTPQTDRDTSYPQQNVHRTSSDANGASVFSGFVIDILDYANTNKNKTLRSLGGFDDNGSGRIVLNSGLWMSTSAIASIYLFSVFSENFKQYSSFALYGIRG